MRPDPPEPCAAGEVGEIWVHGASVAQGYWRQPEESERVFNASLPDGRGPFLRTGDLGFVADGELFVTGRLKDLIILRGRNHYPQDVEITVERSHAALRPGCSAAFAFERDGEERLAVVAEVHREHRLDDAAEIAGILASIRRAVADEHEVAPDAVVLLRPAHAAQDLQRQDPAPRLPRRLPRRHPSRRSPSGGPATRLRRSTPPPPRWT